MRLTQFGVLRYVILDFFLQGSQPLDLLLLSLEYGISWRRVQLDPEEVLVSVTVTSDQLPILAISQRLEEEVTEVDDEH